MPAQIQRLMVLGLASSAILVLPAVVPSITLSRTLLGEPSGQPERRIKRFVKTMSTGRRPVTRKRYPTGDITLRRWLTDYIAHAFRNVQLDGGLTIYEGESRDRYGDAREERLALSAERIDWRRVPVGDLVARHCALSFLDAQGFRFYTPAIMTVIVNDLDSNGVLTESFLFHIHDIRASCKVRDTHYCTLYNQAQRAAIIRFVKYLAHNVRGGWHDDAMDRTLTKLPECCRQPQHSG